MPGIQELLVILLIVIVIFGASKLPQLGKGLGEGIRNFKKGLKSEDEPAALPKEGENPTKSPE
jgi:sec-independent protein translocase protein TatA